MNKQKPSKQAEPQEVSPVDNAIQNVVGSEILKKHGKTIVYGILIAALGVSVLISQLSNWQSKDYDRNKALGPAYIYFNNNQMDSAEVFLQTFLQSPRSGLVASKANLLLARAQYSLSKYQEALNSFEKVKGSGKDHDLLSAGKTYGIASCFMQLGQYESAITSLEKFISSNMKKGSGDDQYNPDYSPSIPGALWKAALCYHQLKNSEKTRQTCEKLVQNYSGSEEAGKASQLLLNI